jgi:hypothetical protein
MFWLQHIIKAILFGVFAILAGYISNFLISLYQPTYIPPECENWNQYHIMEKSLFITGLLLYIFVAFCAHYEWHTIITKE